MDTDTLLHVYAIIHAEHAQLALICIYIYIYIYIGTVTHMYEVSLHKHQKQSLIKLMQLVVKCSNRLYFSHPQQVVGKVKLLHTFPSIVKTLHQ